MTSTLWLWMGSQELLLLLLLLALDGHFCVVELRLAGFVPSIGLAPRLGSRGAVRCGHR